MRIIGITGGVASGKTTYANQLADELRTKGQSVDVISTDGFIFPLKELEARGLLGEKGSPRTHDLALLQQFLSHARAGKRSRVPLYSHAAYDRLEDTHTYTPVDVLIIEGVGVAGAVDTLDEFIYIDTPLDVAKGRFLRRVQEMVGEDDGARALKCSDEQSESLPTDAGDRRLPPQYAGLTLAKSLQKAEQIWEEVNLPNYYAYTLPSRSLAQKVI
jgi:type I pantothenate kinase